MENLAFYLPFLIPAVVAQFGERQRWARYTTYALLVAINVGLLGIVGLALLNEFARSFTPHLLEPMAVRVDWLAVAAICLLTSLLAFLPLLPPVRRWLAGRLPIDPDSLVHMTALAFVVYQLGLTLAQMALIGDLENLIDAGLTLSIWDVLLNGLPLALFALVGVGLFIRRDLRSTLDRLGLQIPTWQHLIVAAVLVLALLALNYGLTLLWESVDPEGYDLVERVTESLFGGLTTVAGAVVLGLSAGISEEMLFRGAVQPRLGILLTTVLFAVGHLQYGLTLAMLQVFIIGLVLGWVRQRSNTTTCILIHSGYNTLIMILGLLLP